MSIFNRVYGVASYTAVYIQDTNIIELTATGMVPCYNYKAQLEMRPERIIPPMWDMIFYVQDICLTAFKPFSITVQMHAMDAGVRSITVYDATGSVSVPVSVLSSEKIVIDFASVVANKSEKYVVYSLLPASQPHGCLVVPANAIVIGIYSRVFGPASKADCEAWAAKNCSPARGGEVPWPKADR